MWSEGGDTVPGQMSSTTARHRRRRKAPTAPSVRQMASRSRRSTRVLALAIAGAFLLTGCSIKAGVVQSMDSGRRSPPPGVELSHAAPASHPGVPEPDPRLTPGAVLPNVTVAQICRRGFAHAERSVSVSMKRQVFRAYRTRYVPGRYEVDHLVPLELGGANVARDRRTSRVVVTANLWPQPRGSAAVKDRLENRLHDEVCGGRESLRAAQRAIARDWYATWILEGRP
jgi:hypothetical protein